MLVKQALAYQNLGGGKCRVMLDVESDNGVQYLALDFVESDLYSILMQIQSLRDIAKSAKNLMTK
jgi:hypothetical protein